MRFRLVLFGLIAFVTGIADAQTRPSDVKHLLEQSLQEPAVVVFQLRQYLAKKVPKPPTPSTAGQWTAEAKKLRHNLLDKIVFHGWPKEWIEAPLKVDDLGIIPSGSGYRMRKLRYEIVPGFQSTAILYEPETIRGKIPAVLNVNGHVGRSGKAVEYKQKRCINQARMGILALNLEWIFMGELSHPENEHSFGAHLDLVGANAYGLFYLAMRKGLDYLYEHPAVDRSRIGVTGLSGGGAQTIMLGSLDERVFAVVPVAGYCSILSGLERPSTDVGVTHIEQFPSDMLSYADYPHLTALRAPRPTLLIYNAEDECCFRAPLVKPYIFDQVRPIFRLYGEENQLGWHENNDPSTHNYQLDNRLQAYRFFSRQFGQPVVDKEIPVDAEIKSAEELAVGLPQENLTILGLAKKLTNRIRRIPGDREKLKEIVRYSPVSVAHAWALGNSKSKGLETQSYDFEFSNGLGATGVWFKAIAASAPTSVTIVLNDDGKRASEEIVSDRVNRGEEVLALDLLFTGDMVPSLPSPDHLRRDERFSRLWLPLAYTQALASVGDRPLGLEAAQLIALIPWLHKEKVRLQSSGIRSHVVALVAAALEPDLFSEVVIRNGMPSLLHLLEKPVQYRAAPDLFCLDLYKEFDLERLAEMARVKR